MDELHGLKNYRIATEEDRKGPKPEGTMIRVDGTTYWGRSSHPWTPGFTYAVPLDCPLEGWEECTKKEWLELDHRQACLLSAATDRYFRRKPVSQTITAELCGDELRFGDHVFKEAT